MNLKHVKNNQKASPCRRPGNVLDLLFSNFIDFGGFQTILTVALDWASFCRSIGVENTPKEGQEVDV